MRHGLRLAAVVAAGLWGTGCVWTQYYKEVVSTQDGDGKVISVVVTERIIQPNNVANPIVFEHIQLVPVNAQGQPSTPTVLPQNTAK